MQEEERSRTAPALRAAAAIALVGAVLLPGAEARATYEAVSFGVNDFTGAGKCSSTDSNYNDYYIDLFYTAASSSSYWDYLGRHLKSGQ